MLYCSMDMARNGCNCYFWFWAIFCPFTSLTTRKIKIFTKWKKHLEISSFYNSVLKIIIIICYTVPEIWHVTWAIFCSFTTLTAQKINIKKKKKMPGDIIILYKCTKNDDHTLYCSWDMLGDRFNCYFSFWAIFCPFTAKKDKILKNEKNI